MGYEIGFVGEKLNYFESEDMHKGNFLSLWKKM